MLVALYNGDRRVIRKKIKRQFPNIALMKIAAYHRKLGDEVEWFDPEKKDLYGRAYMSRVFPFSKVFPEEAMLPEHTIRGGSGFNLSSQLPEEIEHLCPDYSFSDFEYSIGYTTRGCFRNCPWCVVPEKEGWIRKNADVTEFLRHRDVVILDNNILGCRHGIDQLKKMRLLGLRVDVNEGFDARRIDGTIARLLADVRWKKPIRLACDQSEMMPVVARAVERLRAAGATPRRYFSYILVEDDLEEAYERAMFLRSLNVDPYAQIRRDYYGLFNPTAEQRHFVRWVNHKGVFRTVPWPKYLEGRLQAQSSKRKRLKPATKNMQIYAAA